MPSGVIMPESGQEPEAGHRLFATTHWSVVPAAGEGESEPAQRALETICIQCSKGKKESG